MRLLKRLLPSQDIDALLGDIAEERQRGRSASWYWLQVGAAAIVVSWRDVRKHPLLALRAAGVGLVALVVVFSPALAILHVVRVLSEGGYYVGAYWLTLPPSSFRWLPVLVNPLGFAASGWAIVRFHRAHGLAMLLPWTLLVCGLPLTTIINVLTYHGHPIPATPWLVGGVISTLSLPAWVVLGGALGIQWKHT